MHSPRLALDPLGQVVAHLDGEVMAVQGLHLVEGVSLQLLGLDPHGHVYNLLSKQSVVGVFCFFSSSPFKSPRANIHAVIKAAGKCFHHPSRVDRGSGVLNGILAFTCFIRVGPQRAAESGVPGSVKPHYSPC